MGNQGGGLWWVGNTYRTLTHIPTYPLNADMDAPRANAIVVN
jgi:hypothetical protein